MSVRAVAFDWGGTLTPWFDVDLRERWMAYATVFASDHAEDLAQRLHAGEMQRWDRQFETAGHSGTGALEQMFQECGVDTSSPRHAAALAAYLASWEPNTHTDPQAAPLLERLRGRGLRTAVLSNTMWPRRHHEHVLERDGILHLFDYLLFTSETPSAKPHESVFADVMYHLDVEPSECVFVGDRLFACFPLREREHDLWIRLAAPDTTFEEAWPTSVVSSRSTAAAASLPARRSVAPAAALPATQLLEVTNG